MNGGIIPRGGVAWGRVCACSLRSRFVNWLTNWFSHPFPPHLQNTKNPKPLEIGTWIIYTLFTTCHVSCVMCHMSHVTHHIFFWQIGEASWWRVCYQSGLPHLNFHQSCQQILKLKSNTQFFYTICQPILPTVLPYLLDNLLTHIWKSESCDTCHYFVTGAHLLAPGCAGVEAGFVREFMLLLDWICVGGWSTRER